MGNTGSSSSSSGIGFLGVLTIVFIVLKLTGNIAWSWLWVLAPAWIPTVVILLIAAGLLTITITFRKKLK